MKKWLIPGIGQGKYKTSYLMPENTEVLILGTCQKETEASFTLALSSFWTNLGQFEHMNNDGNGLKPIE